jgi:hypothetical protein
MYSVVVEVSVGSLAVLNEGGTRRRGITGGARENGSKF